VTLKKVKSILAKFKVYLPNNSEPSPSLFAFAADVVTANDDHSKVNNQKRAFVQWKKFDNLEVSNSKVKVFILVPKVNAKKLLIVNLTGI